MHLVQTMKLLPQPWKNHAGITREIAVGPNHGEGPEWRVSLADVERDGAFSSFPGMDRIFTVAEGEVAVLRIDGVEHPLEAFRPYRFDGGAVTTCALPTGPVRALNVFAATGRYSAAVLVVELSRKQPLQLRDQQILVLLKGSARVQEAAGQTDVPEIALSLFDAVLDADGCSVVGRGFAALLSVTPV